MSTLFSWKNAVEGRVVMNVTLKVITWHRIRGRKPQIPRTDP